MLLAHVASGFVAGLALRWVALVMLAPVLLAEALLLYVGFGFGPGEIVLAIVGFQLAFSAGLGFRCLVKTMAR